MKTAQEQLSQTILEITECPPEEAEFVHAGVVVAATHTLQYAKAFRLETDPTEYVMANFIANMIHLSEHYELNFSEILAKAQGYVEADKAATE